MKMDKYLLTEIVNAFLTGLSEKRDVSALLRELDVTVRDNQVCLSDEHYLSKNLENPYKDE